MLNDKEFQEYTDREVNKHWLKTIRQDRDELMQRINDLDRLEVSIIKMMGKEGEK